jgi:hypothetical protein
MIRKILIFCFCSITYAQSGPLHYHFDSIQKKSRPSHINFQYSYEQFQLSNNIKQSEQTTHLDQLDRYYFSDSKTYQVFRMDITQPISKKHSIHLKLSAIEKEYQNQGKNQQRQDQGLADPYIKLISRVITKPHCFVDLSLGISPKISGLKRIDANGNSNASRGGHAFEAATTMARNYEDKQFTLHLSFERLLERTIKYENSSVAKIRPQSIMSIKPGFQYAYHRFKLKQFFYLETILQEDLLFDGQRKVKTELKPIFKIGTDINYKMEENLDLTLGLFAYKTRLRITRNLDSTQPNQSFSKYRNLGNYTINTGINYHF